MNRFTTTKPTAPGAYWVRGFRSSVPQQTALITVTRHISGHLMCDLHQVNTDVPNTTSRMFVEHLARHIEWCGPLVPSASLENIAGAAEKTLAALDKAAGIDAGEDVVPELTDAIDALEQAAEAARRVLA